ncbi:MAG: carbohydrate kinase [Acidobacteriaceae bacterium]
MRIVSVGEILWDVLGEGEFLGGAPLNFSICSQRLGNDVALVSAVGNDRRGAMALQAIEAHGLATEFIQTIAGQPTGTATSDIDESGSANFNIQRLVAYDFLNLGEPALERLADMQPDWIYFGTLAQTSAGNEALLGRLITAAPGARCFYDLNLREGQWSTPLVERLAALASILKLSEAEAELLFGISHVPGAFSLERFCESWSRTYGLEIICVTLGERGCAVWSSGVLQTFPGVAVRVIDTVGAGDAFSAAFLHGFERGWPLERTAAFANALGALVAGRAGATPVWTIEELI